MNSKNHKGFTLIELVVVILFITVLSAASAPLLSETLSHFQLSNSMRLLLSTMKRTRGEAINTGFPCSILFTTEANGRINYTAFVDNGVGGGIMGNAVMDGNERQITSGRMPSGVTINNAIFNALPTVMFNGTASPYTQFNAQGFAMGFRAGAATIYAGNLMMNTAGSRVWRRQIEVNVGGQLRINPTIF